MKEKVYASSLSGEEQKEIAIKMWKYIRKWYREHPRTYAHPILIKDEFAGQYYLDTGITIDWHCHCLFCAIFHDDECEGCPLAVDVEDGGIMPCPEYFKLCDPEFPKSSRDRVCKHILDAFKSYNYDKE